MQNIFALSVDADARNIVRGIALKVYISIRKETRRWSTEHHFRSPHLTHEPTGIVVKNERI